MLKLFLLIGIVALPSSAQIPPHPKWAEEPDNFKGVKFLDSMEAAKEHSPAIGCGSARMVSSSKGSCSLMIDLPGGLGQIETSFNFVDDKMRLVSGTFPSAAFPQVKDIFIAKYGKPAFDQLGEVQNGFGVKFEQDTMTWIGDKVAIVLARYSSTVKEGTLMICLVDDVAQKMRETEAQKKGVLN
jgi:hypothetical protein